MYISLARTTRGAATLIVGRLGLLVAAVGVMLLSAALPAAAHVTLVGSDPADGATLTSPPTVITLTFNEPVQGDFSQVVVLDAAGGHHESGKPHVAGGEVHQEVGPLSAGSFQVSYQVVSADGHPVDGTLAFSITGSAPQENPAATAAPSAAASAPAATTPTATATGNVAPTATSTDTPTWVMVAAVAVVLVGAVFMATVALRRRQAERIGSRRSQ